VIPLAVSCSTTRNPGFNEPSGASNLSERFGVLRVYSAQETIPSGEAEVYHPHTTYTIHNSDGSVFDHVLNRIGDMDQEPTSVQLPAGDYVIKAKSESAGWVTIPIKVESGSVITVHLDSFWNALNPLIGNATLIRLPDGRIAGWYAEFISKK
jgi:hypothetical protein